jgi:hypothetical protein
MRTIAAQWSLFEQLVVPKNAHSTQRQEMRRAFYAGAEAMLRLQYEIGGADVSEDAGVALMEGWHDECRRFAGQVAKGGA